MGLRSAFRVPMGIFDEYRSLYFRYPRAMNFWMMYSGTILILFLGKGAEKITLKGGKKDEYEHSRRTHRFFVPYSYLCDYKFKFPENK